MNAFLKLIGSTENPCPEPYINPSLGLVSWRVIQPETDYS
jgi:hypothetical protein